VVARARQQVRQGKVNSQLTPKEIQVYIPLPPTTLQLLKQAETKFHLSARSVHRLLKVARTIADIADDDTVSVKHVAEALQYREQLQQYLPDFV